MQILIIPLINVLIGVFDMFMVMTDKDSDAGFDPFGENMIKNIEQIVNDSQSVMFKRLFYFTVNSNRICQKIM
jgi:hypothetical protein